MRGTAIFHMSAATLCGASGILIATAPPWATPVIVASPVAAIGGWLAVRYCRLEDAIMVLMSVAAALSGLLSLRLVTEVTVADLVLVVVTPLVVVLAILRHSPAGTRSMFWPFWGLVLMAAGGFVGTIVAAAAEPAAISGLVKFTLSTAFVVGLVALWRPSVHQTRIVAWGFFLGAVANSVCGIFVYRDFFGRSLGFTDQPNHLAIAAMFGLGVGLGLLFTTTSSGVRALAAAMLLLVGIAIVTSGSRAGLVGAIVVVAAFALLSRRWTTIALGTLLLGVAAVIAVSIGWVDLGDTNAVTRLLGDSSADRSDAARSQLRESSLERVDRYPFTGTGFANAQEAHSLYLQVWDATGLLGLIGFAVVIGVTIRAAWTAFTTQHLLLAGFVSPILAYFVAAVVSNQFWDRYIWLIVALAFALEGAVSDHPTKATASRIGLRSSPVVPSFRQ